MTTKPTRVPPAHVTADLVAARKVAAEIIPLIESECDGKSLDFTRRLWSIVQERSIAQIGLPKRALAGDIEPLNDRAAEAFRDVPIAYGKYKGHTVGEIEQSDPSYLAMLADGTDFTKQLKRLLARTKYHGEDGDDG